MAVKEISSASQRIVTVPPFKAKESYRNLFKPPLAEAAKKELVDSKQAFLKLEMNRIFGNWMRNVSELNPHLQFEIYSKTGDVGAHALFYSAENLNDTCEQCKASLSQIDAIDGLSIENRYLHHRIRNVIGSVYATANYSMNGSASYIFPVDMPKTGDKEYVLRLTEAKMAQMGWLSGIWNAIVKSDYIGELKKFGYANGDEEAHMKKCFTALPGAMKRLGAAATAREVKYDDVASVSGSTYVLCYSVLDMDIELYGPAGSKAREIVSYLKATLYDNNKLFELFNSALLENTPNLRREQLEGWVLQRPGGVYYLNTKELAKNSIFRKNNDKFKVRQVANLAGHIYELSTFISEE